MSYKLKKPYTKDERKVFVVTYNNNLGMRIEETDDALYALEANEIMVDSIPQIDAEYEEKQKEAELIRKANLHLTRGDVFRGLLLAKGKTRADIRAIIDTMPESTPEQKIEKEMASIDFDEALEFYRGVALIDNIGKKLGITSDQMDRFFDTRDWHALTDEVE